MKTALSLVVVALALSGCATITGDLTQVQPADPKPDQATAQAMAETALRESLRDPEGAQIRNWTRVYKSMAGLLVNEPVWAICAEVNGKNAYGGYVGFKHMQVIFRNGAPGKEPAAVSEMPYGCDHVAKDDRRQ